MTKEEWEAARAMWCSDSREGYGWMVDLLGGKVSRQAISKRAAKEGWEKVVQPSSKVVAQPAPKVVAQPKQPQPKKPAKAPAQPEDEAPAGLPALSQRDRELMLGRRPVGRPTDYRPEFVAELIAYFDIEVRSVAEVDVTDKDGKTRTEKTLVVNTFPTLTRFAAKIGVTRQTLHDWATAKDRDGALLRPEFAYAYARAKDAQESLLVEGGMTGVYEPRFAVFAAKNLAGWKDQIETTGEVTHTLVKSDELDELYAQGTAAMEANRARVAERKRRALDAVDVDVREVKRGR